MILRYRSVGPLVGAYKHTARRSSRSDECHDTGYSSYFFFWIFLVFLFWLFLAAEGASLAQNGQILFWFLRAICLRLYTWALMG